ncbi:DUF2190 domain-containing protein [Rhizobium sp. YIM 134829]|uniref:structural cement protein Gp24 n=1 Tax=Rhizobium sp. YIM 134829 TaxID=3390453 RepID=UPI00397B39C8
MANIQSSYAATHARWIEGMVPDMRPSVDITRVVETAGGIGFGKVAQRGTADNQCKVSSASPKFLGITLLDNTQVGATVDTYPQYANAAIRQKGPVVVQASVAVAQGDDVYFVPATGVLTNVSSGNVQIPGAKWETSTTGAGLAVVFLG